MPNLRLPDKMLLAALVILLILGVLALVSAAHQKQIHLGKNFLSRQVIWIIIGAIVMIFTARISYRSFLSAAYIIYVIQLFFLLLVLLLGKETMGAQRWLSVGGVSFQPSEFAKIFTILALARVIGDNPQKVKSVKGLILPGIILVMPMTLIFLQPDLGTALMFMPIALSMLWAAGIRLKHFVLITGTAAAAVPFAWSLLREYQKNRLLIFLDPSLDPLGAGYTINQSKISIGSGMLFGKGWFAGTQNKLSFLPERHTDFIFSVIGEEWGFIGTSLVMLMFALLLGRSLKIAGTTADMPGKLIALGMTTMIAFHVIINIGMTLGLMPVVGLPLPFISYGGSALVTHMAAVGFVLSVKKFRTVF